MFIHSYFYWEKNDKNDALVLQKRACRILLIIKTTDFSFYIIL